MKITADKEGLIAIQKLLDLALKSGGLQNKQFVDQIIASVKEEAVVEETK